MIGSMKMHGNNNYKISYIGKNQFDDSEASVNVICDQRPMDEVRSHFHIRRK